MFKAVLQVFWYMASWIPLVGRFFAPSPPQKQNLDRDLPPAKVAIVGAGIGGCFSAKFLRELGGQKLDIHIWNKRESSVGGRTKTIQVGDHWYEAGASIAHSSNKYLSDAVKEHGLEITKDITVPLGIFNGHDFVFRTGTSKIISIVKTLWHFGFSLFRMESGVSSLLKKFKRIYTLQETGQSYATVQEMLKGMDHGGDSVYNLTQVSARDHFTEAGWSDTLINELVTGAMRMNYGQSCQVNALCTYVSLAGIEDGSLWSVVGGNWQIAEKVLEASGATLHPDDVTTITRVKRGGQIKYKIAAFTGECSEEFNVVIVANPLNTSAINYVDFPTPIYTTASTTPYQRTVAEFVKGRINKQFFHAPQSEKTFPLVVLTTDMTGEPFEYRTVAVDIPAEASQEEVKDYIQLYDEEPVRMWKLFTPRPLSEDEKKEMFTDIEAEATVDWLAYPKYNPPDQCPPFILDDGMFYVNAIEKAASAMEMSAIGAKNVALLAREYLLTKSDD